MYMIGLAHSLALLRCQLVLKTAEPYWFAPAELVVYGNELAE